MATRAAAPPASPARNRAGAPYERLGGAERYLHRTRDRDLLALLRRHGVADLGAARILELGCGEASLVRSLLHYGADLSKIDAVDLDGARLARARALLPGVRVARGDIAALPYPRGAFDLAFAFTVFSSVPDSRARRLGAAEALRVLRPGGLLVVYDFWLNPLNPAVHPVRARELRALFAPRPVTIERVTLAPPIVRLLRGARALCAPLERLPWLRTHLLAAVTKEG